MGILEFAGGLPAIAIDDPPDGNASRRQQAALEPGDGPAQGLDQQDRA